MSTKKTKKVSKRRGMIEERDGKFSYRISYRDSLGKRCYERESGFSTKKEAEAACSARLAKLDEGFAKDSKTRLDTYLTRWMEDQRRLGTWKPTTAETTRIHVERYIIPNIGSKTLGNLRPVDLREFYAALTEGGRTGRVPRKDTTKPAKGLSAKTVRNVAGTLHKALEDAVELKLLTTNPAAKVKPPKWERPKLTVWDEVQVGTFLNYCQETGDDHLPYWRLLFTTGLRRGEILGLRWIDVDFASSVLRIEQARVVTNGKVIISTPKTDSGQRGITLDSETLIELARLKNQQEERLGTSAVEYVATRPDGRPIHPLTFTRRFQETARKAGLPVMRLHDGRHTSANLALQHGVPLTVLAGRLGHSKPSTTLDIYGAFLPSADRMAADVLGRIVSSAERASVERETNDA